MDTFGRKLREVIESRGLSLEDVAQASGLGIHEIMALESGDHGALPEDEAVTDGLKAFARLVDVDPDEVVDDFRRERESYRRAAPTDVEVAVVRDVPPVPGVSPVPDVVVQQAASRSSRSPALLALAAAVLVLAAVGFSWFQFSGRNDLAPATPVASIETSGMETSAGQGVNPEENTLVPMEQAPDAVVAKSEPPAPAPPAEMAVAPSGLVIAHHGVGTGVVNHELIGEAGRFAEGTQVWFWTWVEGATSGQMIHHVWLHEGQEVLSVSLRLGGARWRTQSYKNLHADTTGAWAVEARDEAGRVLARRDFQSFSPAAD